MDRLDDIKQRIGGKLDHLYGLLELALDEKKDPNTRVQAENNVIHVASTIQTEMARISIGIKSGLITASPKVVCFDCGIELTPLTTIDYDNKVYCFECVPVYDKHQQF